MRFIETELAGVVVVEPEPITDERGFFARTWCQATFAEHGLNPHLVQCNISFNVRRGTLRGMHYQVAPHAEAKLVRCTAGAIYDVVIDLRPEAPTYRRWIGVELTSSNQRQIYVPEGCAHGFQTLADNSEVLYQMSAVYVPEAAHGVRWNDPAFGIVWPEAVHVISAKDQHYPDYRQ
jgi:dTDP-4-dehydrorhamnose 3,5-epimerase